MAHTFRSHYFHLIWSIKNRENYITEEVRARLYAYIGGIIKSDQNNLLSIGGTSNHVHLLIAFNSIDKFSYLIRDVKAKSSFWVHQNFPQYQHFAWQEGYASFSISYSSVEKVIDYIKNQEMHHKNFSFEDEFLQILRKNEIKYDDRYVLG